jgi:hypothetical protein
MLTKEDVGARVQGVAHNCEGSIVAVYSLTIADIRWDFGARHNWQQLDKDFQLNRQEKENAECG